ncbi:hypothetical protein EMIT0P12_10586 [Pseudomonas sp. IT-P12]
MPCYPRWWHCEINVPTLVQLIRFRQALARPYTQVFGTKVLHAKKTCDSTSHKHSETPALREIALPVAACRKLWKPPENGRIAPV